MARFAGKVGFGVSTEVQPGEFTDEVIEKQYYGDVKRVTRQAVTLDKVNDDVSLQNAVEIVADSYVSENIFAIRYVVWSGSRWKVTGVEVQGVRLVLTLGGVYNGPTPSVSN